MNHILSRPVKQHEFGGIGKDATCYYYSWNNHVVALIGTIKGQPCFVPQVPLPIGDVEIIINDYIDKSFKSRSACAQ